MENHGLHTYDDSSAKPTRSMRPTQSMWMDRWMTNSDRTLQVHNQISVRDQSTGNDPDLQHEARVVHTVKPSKHKMLDINAAPCNISEYRNSWRCQREDIIVASELPQSGKAVEVVTETKRVEITYETLITNSRRSSKVEIQPISMFDFSKTFGSILAQKRMAVSFEDESTTQTDDFKGATTVKPSNSNSLFKALRSTPSDAAIQLKKYHSQPENRLQHQGQSGNPYMSLDKNKMHNGDPGNGMHNLTPNGLLPSHSCSEQVKRFEELNRRCHSSSDVSQPIVGSVEGVSSGPKFSQTAKHLYITDVSKGNQIPRPSTISTKFAESASHKLFTLLPDFDCHNEYGEKLQPLGRSRNSERKNDERTGFLASKNESSAETEAMDINVCQTWDSLPSTTSSQSYKDTMVGEKAGKSHSTTHREDVGSRKMKLVDINMDPPSPLAAEQEIDKMELSNSRTESLDWEQLHQNSSPQQCHAVTPDPSSRWVKRLKLSSWDHDAQGTKSVKMTDYNRTSLRPTFDKVFGEEVENMELDKTALPLVNKEDGCMDSVKEGWGLNLSDPWIQRWCHSEAQAPRPQMKMALDDEYQTKQFPSIAAMALMGKTMNGLQSCKFHHQGSFIVWGTGGF